MIAEHPLHWKRFDRDEFYGLYRCGVITESYELIEGELFTETPVGRLHVYTVYLLIEWLKSLFGNGYVQQENPVDVSSSENRVSEPQPDATVLKSHLLTYREGNPGTDDILFVAEVSESTLQDDLVRKAALYARADFPEYWVLDISGRQIYVHREPREGRYTSVEIYGKEQIVSLLAKPEIRVQVKTLFPQETDLI